ncbi:hypothetical protein GCG54_00004365 [Colletotrichum gloeosporioides]|uniref:Uncharacterized protein n=1 Tax=Colletotrichum gloeosporioides TaxID=474922 RepID=A0A8H4CL92_COLGL|nr:uncharacterized protein GCG54_00004365 [Colletotrichum gloeosporioides]KAF3806040.1 hypothetical protein GCG54_00004365 [Colletotrichum gloeosporioides]
MLQDTADRASRRWSRSTNGCVTCYASDAAAYSGIANGANTMFPFENEGEDLALLNLAFSITASHAAQFTPESDENPGDWEGSPSETAVEATESMGTTHLVLNRTANIEEQATLTTASSNAAALPLSTLTARHVPSRCSILFGPLEQDALYFFENVFSKLSPKTFLWSKLAIVLHHAYDDAAIMHLLLASCLSTVARGHSDHQVLRTAKSHFKRGTTRFVDGIQEHSYNHAQAFMVFWLLQLTYRAIWDGKSRSAMKNLSTALVNYVHRHRILELFGSNRGLFESLSGSASAEGDFAADSSSLNPVAMAKKSLLASLLLFTAYEDLDSEFCGSGGQFAELILSGNDTSRSLFACSRNIHADFFGSSYPWEELMDDVERSRPLELHFFSNICLNRLNRAHACGIDVEELREIEAILHTLREDYSAIFKLAEAPYSAGRKLIETSYSIVAHFYAILVCVLVDMASTAPSESLQREFAVAKDNLLRVIFRMATQCTDNPVMWRNQWALFVMARESNDEIHRDWLLHKLGNSSYAAALKDSSAQDFNPSVSRDD